MSQIKLLSWKLDVDLDKTKEYYSRNLELCDCLYCKNYMEATMNLPASIIEVFNMLGIDSSKPAHLSEFGEKEDKCRLYIGSYHLIGKLVDGEYCSDAEWNEKNTAKIENYRFGFNKEVNFVQDPSLKPILQLDFEASIPWVLNERPED